MGMVLAATIPMVVMVMDLIGLVILVAMMAIRFLALATAESICRVDLMATLMVLDPIKETIPSYFWLPSLGYAGCPAGRRAAKAVSDGIKSIFLGYSGSMKNILFYNRATGEIKECQHVIFHESVQRFASCRQASECAFS